MFLWEIWLQGITDGLRRLGFPGCCLQVGFAPSRAQQDAAQFGTEHFFLSAMTCPRGAVKGERVSQVFSESRETVFEGECRSNAVTCCGGGGTACLQIGRQEGTLGA